MIAPATMDSTGADHLTSIPLDLIIEPRNVLRLVDRESVEYMELRDSLRDRGFLNSICVRPSASRPGRFEVLDGLYRVTAAKEVGIAAAPCIVKPHATDDDVLALQITANAVRPETRPIEFANQMKKMLTRRPEMTLAELATLVRKSPRWVSDRLGLVRLCPPAQKGVERGEIPLANAFMLAKVPGSLQRDYLDDARAMNIREFRVLVAALVKRVAEAVRQGKLEAFFTDRFAPQPHLRDLRTIQEEIAERRVGPLLLAAEGAASPVDGFYAALRWATHQDPQSARDQEEAFRQRQRKHLPVD